VLPAGVIAVGRVHAGQPGQLQHRTASVLIDVVKPRGRASRRQLTVAFGADK
jgi:hypothetical protein